MFPLLTFFLGIWRRLSRAAGMWGSGNPLDSHSSFKNGEAINIPTAVKRSEHLEFHQFHPVFFLQHQHSGTPGSSPGCPAWPHTEVDLPLPEDGSVNRITQVIQEMAKEVFLMAQSLRRRGCILVLDLQWVVGGLGTTGGNGSPSCCPAGARTARQHPGQRDHERGPSGM